MKEPQHAATGCGVGSSPAHSACFGVSPDRTTAGFPPIAIERTNETGLRHTERAISMASWVMWLRSTRSSFVIPSDLRL